MGIEQGTLTFEKLQKIRWNKVFQSLEIEFDGEEFERYFREQLFESAIPEPGAYEMLHALKKKDFILCVASNGPYAQQVHRLEIAEMKQFLITYLFQSRSKQRNHRGIFSRMRLAGLMRAERLPFCHRRR